MKRTALLFDLDGTVVDSVADLAAAANRLLAEHGRPALSVAEVATMVGDGMPKLVERVLAASGAGEVPLDGAVRRFVTLYERDATTLTRPYPDAVAVLEELARAGAALAICTNKPEHATRSVLDGLGLTKFFSVVLGGDSLATRKPDPAPLRVALDRLGGAPQRAAMIGDHRNDILAARSAGIGAIFARYGYGLATLGGLKPDAMIDGFSELPDTLHRLFDTND